MPHRDPLSFLNHWHDNGRGIVDHRPGFQFTMDALPDVVVWLIMRKLGESKQLKHMLRLGHTGLRYHASLAKVDDVKG